MIIYDNIINSINPVGGIAILFNELYQRAARDNLAFSVIQPSNRSHFKIARYMRCKTDSVASTSSVFHSTYYRLPTSKCKVITTVHDFTYERYIKGFRAYVHGQQKSKAVHNSDLIICVSENTKSDLLYYYPKISEERVHVVHNGASDSYRPLSDIQRNDRNILYIGNRRGYKNFNLLVQALHIGEGYFLDIVGGGELSEQELLVLESAIPKQYRHHGNVDEATLNTLLNQSLCLVYPSLYEGFGIPVIEAMKAGCPVIACKLSSIPEVAGTAAILIEGQDPKELLAAINLLDDASLRREKIKQGLAQSSHFSWEECYSQTRLLYESLLP